MRPSMYYPWDTLAMILQMTVHPFSSNAPPPAVVEGEFTEMATVPNVSIPETTGTAE